ncbi:MAG: HigA family addiction module antitoxin [Pseudomonadota bacterium]
MAKLRGVTPGELLLEEFLKPMDVSRQRLAKEIGVPAKRIGGIVAGERAITADTDLRLCRFFGLSNGYWLRAQITHDTEGRGARDGRAARPRSNRGRAGEGRDSRVARRVPSATGRRKRS